MKEYQKSDGILGLVNDRHEVVFSEVFDHFINNEWMPWTHAAEMAFDLDGVISELEESLLISRGNTRLVWIPR